MNLKNIITVSLSMLVSITAWSQGKLPVNNYTGTAFVNVPIGVVRDKDLSQGVSLSYATGGIKVEQQAGLVGLGWNIAAGGSISREVRGLPDDVDISGSDSRRGWLTSNNAQDIGNFSNTTSQTDGNCDNEVAVWSSINGLLDSFQNDTEPDVFYFNFGGYAGKFLFDNNGTIRTTPYYDFDIQYTQGGDNLITSFSVTTQDGMIYAFNSHDEVDARTYISHPMGGVTGADPQYFQKDYHYYEFAAVDYYSSWQLTSIKSPTTDAEIILNYISSTVTYDDPVELMVAQNNANYNPEKELIYFKRYNHTRKVISRIRTSFDNEIKFIYSVLGNDQFRRQLDAIEIYNGESGTKKLIREYELTYTGLGWTFKDDITYERKFLKSVQEKSGTSTLPPYTFEYYGVTWDETDLSPFPADAANGAQDAWGYFNGTTQGLKSPKLYFFPDEYNSNRYRLYDWPGYTGTKFTLKGADRIPRASYAKVATLNRITWPTGGQTLLFHEGHRYRDHTANKDQKGGGVRLAMQVAYDGVSHDNDITWTYDYEKENGQSAGHLVYPAVFAVPSSVYEDFDTGNITGSDLLPPTSAINANKIIARTIGNMAMSETSQGSVVVYDRVTEKLKGSGKKVFEFETPALFNSTTENSGAWQAATTSLAMNRAKTTLPGSGTLVCTSRGYFAKGAYAYPYTTNPFYDYKRGLLTKTSDYREGSTTAVRTLTYNYGAITPNVETIKGLHLQIEGYEPAGTTSSNITGGKRYFQFSDYTIRTQENTVLTQVVESSVSDANANRSITRTTNYEYGSSNHQFLTKTSTTNSDGKVYSTNYLYPQDLTLTGTLSGTPILAVKNLVDNHRVSIPLEVTSMLGNDVTGASTTVFKLDGTVARTDKVMEFRTGTPTSFTSLTTQVSGGNRSLSWDSDYTDVLEINDFNDSGLTASTTNLISKISSSTIFGYEGQMPVASIFNASPNQTIYSSFENDSEYHFTPIGVGLVSTAYTGKNSFDLDAASSLEASVMKKGTEYYLSFYAYTQSSQILKVRFNGTEIKTINISNTNGEWQYFKEKISPSSWTFGTEFDVEIKAQIAQVSNINLLVDDIAFFPVDAEISTTVYDPAFGVIAKTDAQGKTIFYEYDEHGRAIRSRDLDGNIIQQTSFETMVNQN